MRIGHKILVIAVAVLFLLGAVVIQGAPNVKAFATTADEPLNYIYLDVTYNPQDQSYSLNGFSEEQLKQLGAPGLEQNVWAILERFDGISLEVRNSELNLNADDAKLATIDWDGESRQMLYGLIDSYMMQMAPPVDRERAEDWLSKANFVLKIRNSPDLSDPLIIDLTTLVKVDISKEGKLAVEGFDTGVSLEPIVPIMADAGNIDNAALCWAKSVVKSEINGNALPQITLHQAGLSVIDKAFGLGLGDVDSYFEYQLGASVSFDGAEHLYTECDTW